jgi:4-diphosphocytidyl-2-C-methyl-D-erythritol kinase
MMGEFVLQPPAKINLHLKILERGADGYHSLISVFQKIALFDSIRVKLHPSDSFQCAISGMQSIPLQDNLLYRAAELFCDIFKTAFSVQISLSKHIPLGSGLGGGSSDAASLLRLLSSLFPCSEQELANAAAALGSDIPFFLSDAPAALITGKGEKVSPLYPKKDCSQRRLVLVYPGFPVDTATAYRTLDESRGEGWSSGLQPLAPPSAWEQLLEADVSSWNWRNDFEPIVCNANPVYELIRKTCWAFGARFMGLTGSGSAYYALFQEQKQADSAAAALSSGLPREAAVFSTVLLQHEK